MKFLSIILTLLISSQLFAQLKYRPAPPIKNFQHQSKTLADIESHMPDGHIYKDNDKITWGHETTHGYHSKLRQKHKAFCLYLLNDKCALIKQPNITLEDVANKIPQSLRGRSYELYMVEQRKYWNDEPLYVLDEWICYKHGAMIRSELKIQYRQETVQQMIEFSNYSIAH
jgi:hypothetical protein